MSTISKIESKIESLESELIWLNTRVKEGEDNWLNEDEVDWDSIKSQVEDVENSSNDLIEDIKDLIEALKDLI